MNVFAVLAEGTSRADREHGTALNVVRNDKKNVQPSTEKVNLNALLAARTFAKTAERNTL